MSAEKTDTLLHLLHLVDDALYGVGKVSVEFTIVCLYGTGLGMIGTGQKLILQIEDVYHYLIGFGIVGLLYHLEYDALLKQITSNVVDAFLKFSFVCHSLLFFMYFLICQLTSVT